MGDYQQKGRRGRRGEKQEKLLQEDNLKMAATAAAVGVTQRAALEGECDIQNKGKGVTIMISGQTKDNVTHTKQVHQENQDNGDISSKTLDKLIKLEESQDRLETSQVPKDDIQEQLGQLKIDITKQVEDIEIESTKLIAANKSLNIRCNIRCNVQSRTMGLM